MIPPNPNTPPFTASLLRIVSAVLGRDRRTLAELAADKHPVISEAAIAASDDLSGSFPARPVQWNSGGTPAPVGSGLSTLRTGQSGPNLVINRAELGQ